MATLKHELTNKTGRLHPFLREVVSDSKNLGQLFQNVEDGQELFMCLPKKSVIKTYLEVINYEVVASHTFFAKRQENIINYNSINGKEIQVLEQKIATKKGFEWNVEVRILKEEMFYFGPANSILLLYIEYPLLISNQASVNKIMGIPANPRFQDLCILLPVVCQQEFVAFDSFFQEFDESCQTLSYQLLRLKAAKLYHRCAVHCENLKILQELMTCLEINQEMFYLLLESYVNERIYDMSFFSITASFVEDDRNLTNTLSKLKFVDFHHLKIPFCFVTRIFRATSELSSLVSKRNPKDKLHSLVETFRILTDKSNCDDLKTEEGGVLTVNADIVLPLLIIVIIKSQLPQLISTSKYMADFSFHSNTTDGMSGYAFTTFLSVLTYLQSEEVQALVKASEYIESQFSTDQLKKWNEMEENDFLSSFDQNSFSVLDSRNHFGETLLFYALKHNEVKIAKILVKKSPSSALFLNYKLESAINIAIESFFNELIEAIWPLMEKTLHNLADGRGRLPLHIAMKSKNLSLIQFFLENGADINVQDKDGMTPLFLFLQDQTLKSEISVYDYINLKTVNFGLSSQKGMSFSHYGDSKFLSYLLQSDLSQILEKKNIHGETPLLYRAFKGDVETVRYLIENGANIYSKGEKERNLLHYAVTSGNEIVVDYIIKLKAFAINDRDSDGNTPLHLSCAAENAIVSKLLLDNGADISLPNLDMKTCWDITESIEMKNFLDVYRLSKSNDSNKSLRSEVVSSSKVNNSSKMKYLIKTQESSTSDIVTVERVIEDFYFLKSRLHLEYPELFLPELKNLKHHVILGMMESSVTRIQNLTMLNLFLYTLTNHPLISYHEVLWEFLHIQQLNFEAISARCTVKRQNYVENVINSVPPLLPQHVEQDEQAMKLMEEKLQIASKALSDTIIRAQSLSYKVEGYLESLAKVIKRLTHTTEASKCILQGIYAKQERNCPYRRFCTTVDSLLSLQTGCEASFNHRRSVSNEYSLKHRSGEEMARSLERLNIQESRWWNRIAFSDAEREEKTKKINIDLCSTMDEFAVVGSLLNSETQQIRSEFSFLFDSNYCYSDGPSNDDGSTLPYALKHFVQGIRLLSRQQYLLEFKLLEMFRQNNRF